MGRDQMYSGVGGWGCYEENAISSCWLAEILWCNLTLFTSWKRLARVDSMARFKKYTIPKYNMYYVIYQRLWAPLAVVHARSLFEHE